MKDITKGKVYVVKDNIDTDVIIPARYLTTMDPQTLGKHAMEDLDPKQYTIPFLNKDGTCDYKVIVAGKNFGCGSSREHAPIALKAAGIEAVVAKTFARIFYRNAVNGGIILPLESEQDLPEIFKTGDLVRTDLSRLLLFKLDETFDDAISDKFYIKPFGPVKEIIDAGGLTAYNKKRLARF